MSNLNKIRLTVGDRNGDSHGRTKEYVTLSNLDAKEIKNAFDFALRKTDFDWREFQSYSMVIPSEIVSSLMKLGFMFEGHHISETNTCVTCPHLIVDVYKFLVSVGNPHTTFRDIVAEEIHIGGEAVLSEELESFVWE